MLCAWNIKSLVIFSWILNSLCHWHTVLQQSSLIHLLIPSLLEKSNFTYFVCIATDSIRDLHWIGLVLSQMYMASFLSSSLLFILSPSLIWHICEVEIWEKE